VHGGDEHGTGLGSDWIRTMTNFAEFRLDPDWKFPQNLGLGPDLIESMGNICVIFVVEKPYFVLSLDLNFNSFKPFGLWLDLN